MKYCKDTAAAPRTVAALHDLSCYGRCALTVILPVLSAMGHQVIPIPTALLSTHTGGFDELYFMDLTDQMEHISEHFHRLNISFDAIYTGFLGSSRQLGTVMKIIERFGKNSIVLVDPVMGDDGSLYSTYTNELMIGMRELCRSADIITPNLTEACFLTDTEYADTALMSEDALNQFIRKLCVGLDLICDGKKVITGIPHSDGSILTVAYLGNAENMSVARDSEKLRYFENHRLEASYPGTGDIFASVLLGQLLNGIDFYDAVSFACDFVAGTIEYTLPTNTPQRCGVAVEKLLPLLLDRQ